MKLNETFVFVGISSLALVAVLAIQVSWVFQTARMKEQLFNEKANMVLSRTVDALGSDAATCGKIEACIQNETSKLGEREKHTIDSLFKHYLRVYNFKIDYTFVVARPTKVPLKNSLSNAIFNQQIRSSPSLNGVELKLIFPDKNEYLLAEMSAPFVSSVVLILVVLVMFWRTVLSLIKQKKIADHTTDFLNNMTHEFKSPLTNMGLAAKMLVRETQLDGGEKLNRYSGIILEENEKLKLQVEQVLSITALERGEIPLQKVELDFHQLILDSVKCMNLQIEARNGKIEVDLRASQFKIWGDKTHLTNSICNLIDNALKYSDSSPIIKIETWNEGGKFLFSVADSGIGIEKQYQKKVFKKFFRVPMGDVHNVKGFGLGLTYIHKIVELHAGQIRLESEIGEGAKFTITIPNV